MSIARGIQAADGIMVANQLTLKWRNYLALSRWIQCNHKDLISESGRHKRRIRMRENKAG